MNNPFRSLLVTFVLALSMAAGAVVHGMTLATLPRGQADLQEIVICVSDSGEAIISIDSNGNRVDPAQDDCTPLPCADCLGATAYALPPVLSEQVRVVTGRSANWPAPGQIHQERPYTLPAARGPPQKV